MLKRETLKCHKSSEFAQHLLSQEESNLIFLLLERLGCLEGLLLNCVLSGPRWKIVGCRALAFDVTQSVLQLLKHQCTEFSRAAGTVDVTEMGAGCNLKKI